jgi:hypothetical protein
MSRWKQDTTFFLWLLTGALVVSAAAVHWVFIDIVLMDAKGQLAWRIWSPPALSLIVAIGWMVFRR